MFLIRMILVDCELALKHGDYDRALTVSENLSTHVTRTGIRTYLPDAQYFRAQAFLGSGQREAAYRHMVEARTAAEAIGSRQATLPILLALGQRENDPNAARVIRQQAREIVEFFIAQTSTPELRSSFLKLPHVRLALDG